MSAWLLPAHMADILPAEARRTEELRRKILDLFRTSGFELVSPPLLEFTESLLATQSRELALRTTKVIDQLSGRTMGVRADMTPQVTRIDAHLLNRQGVTRLCYCGPVFQARPSNALGDRELLQIGAEIYGYPGPEADLLIIDLVLQTLAICGVQAPRIDLNHSGITRALIQQDPQLNAHAATIFTLLQEKNTPSLRELCERLQTVPEALQQALLALPSLYGDQSVLDKAQHILPDLPAIQQSLAQLRSVMQRFPNASVDLADVSGYDYHTGIRFAVYASAWHNAIVRGGRFDHVSKAFGRARPATGFSLDLRQLVQGLAPAPIVQAIKAPWQSQDASLRQAIAQLRAQGHIVVEMLPDAQQDQDEFKFTQELVQVDAQWQLQDIA
nr:ATP phosphoribosyltransferase regulatory subunit [Brackiella oedipodis]